MPAALALAVGLASGCSGGKGSSGGGVVRDADGNLYSTVTIGSQVWLAESLRVTRSSDGRPLTTFSPENDPSRVALYGRLYDWETARRACPARWRLPSDEDWSLLEGGVGAGEGLELRQLDFWPHYAPRGGKSSGFQARPAGYWNDHGFETYFGTRAVFWTATPQDEHFVWSRVLDSDGALRRAPQHPQYGFSVRCVFGPPAS